MGAGTVSPFYKWRDGDSWPPWKAGTGAVSTRWLRSLTLSYRVYSANIGFLPHARHRAGLWGCIGDSGWHHQGPQEQSVQSGSQSVSRWAQSRSVNPRLFSRTERPVQARSPACFWKGEQFSFSWVLPSRKASVVEGRQDSGHRWECFRALYHSSL